MIDATGELLAIGLFLAVCAALLLGLPGGLHARRHLAPVRRPRLAPRPFRLRLLPEPSTPLLRHHAERDPGRGAAVHLHGLRPRALEASPRSSCAPRACCSAPGRGGLGYAVVLVGAVLAASTGVVGAVVVTMCLISLPTMLRAGYDPQLATGVIGASATLAQLIPPSTVLIFVADMLQGVNQTAQLALGNLAPEPVSVGDLFAGAFLPGLLLVAPVPALGRLPRLAATRRAARRSCWRGRAARPAPAAPLALVFPALLIVSVLGSILAGIATATESASLGAVGALLFAALRGRLGLAPATRGLPAHRAHQRR